MTGDEGSLFYFYNISVDLNIFKINCRENSKLAVFGRLSHLLLLQFRLGQVISLAIYMFPASLTSQINIPCFLTGEDPLVDDQNERDINSVAGVLKLYFRGLENPLFPKERFQDLISTISKYFPGRMINSLTHNLLKLHYGFITVLAT